MAHSTVRYRTSREGLLVWIDSAFADFARENGAPELADHILGTPLADHVAGPEVRSIYETLVARLQTTRQKASFPFRCDSPELRRFMRMTVEPHEDGGLLFTAILEATEARTPPVPTALIAGPDAPGETDDMVILCAWCKRVRGDDGRWLEVEDALELGLLDRDAPGPISHAACPACAQAMLSLA